MYNRRWYQKTINDKLVHQRRLEIGERIKRRLEIGER